MTRAGLTLILFLAFAIQTIAQSTTQYFRISILENQPLAQAEQLKGMLEGWGYTPVLLEQTGETYRVLYGSFPTQADAEAGLAKLADEGITAKQIVQSQGEAAPVVDEGGKFTVIVDTFTQRIDAEKVMMDLRGQGYQVTDIRRVGRFYELSIGDYTLAQSSELLKKLRAMNFVKARAQKVEPLPAPVEVTPVNPAEEFAATEQTSISPLITQSEIWQGLTEDQKKKVINSVVMQQNLGSGDPLAAQVVNIEKRLQNLDDEVKQMITKIQEERDKDRELRETMGQLFKQADNDAKAGKFQDSILAYKQIMEMDPEDRLGQRQNINRYISAMESKLAGENYEGQAADIENRIVALMAEAKEYEGQGTIESLNRAQDRWAEIKRLNPAKYGAQAEERQGAIHGRLETMRQQEKEADEASSKSLMKMLMIGAGAAVGGVVLLIAFVTLQLRRQESKLTEKVQQQLASQMRPMRELGGGGGGASPMIAGGGGRPLPPSEDTDSDIFAPRDSEDFNSDPLGGLAGGMESPKTPAKKDDAFGGSDSTGGGFDSLFGGEDSESRPSTVGSEPTQKSPSDDDIFGNLFDTQAPATGPKTGGGPPAMPSSNRPAAAPATDAGDDHHVPISFGGEDTAPSAAAEDTSDLLSMFDAPIAGGGSAPAAGGGLSDNPFEAMFESVEPGNGSTSTYDPSLVAAMDEDTEIPGITLDVNDPFAPVGGRGGSAETAFHDSPKGRKPENDSTNTGFTDSVDLPSFSFDDMTSSVGASSPPTSVMPALEATVDSLEGGIALSFEDLPIGAQPAGWEGDYDYATLTVEADTPPRGFHQYLAYRKTEGTGKALFTHPFPAIRGKAVIEFDMRCDDKNKFLLGFYIEHDGDFQNSINTKILRSEAQTTPTIHMQGESAPYLLGSWAHIKYVVDLDAGLVNGYIDGTHMARDVPFEKNPGSLNTLAIRDNINTTGVLLLNNIRVYSA